MFRKPPAGFSRLFMRAPIWLYRLRLGWLLASRFLLLEHKGRASGRQRRVVLEVVDRNRETGVYRVAAAYGDRSDWYRNVMAAPKVRVTVGRRRFAAMAEPLTAEDSRTVLERYAAEHPTAVRALAKALGYTSYEDLAERVPIVELRPR